MKASLAALLIALAAILGAPAHAQDAPAADESALNKILTTELPPEEMALAMKLVEMSGTTRLFDELLPNIAEQAKNQFIRANPQMQLGIIAVVDKIAVQLVGRRPDLDRALARVWASAFSQDEMQELVDFYMTDTGKKFAGVLPHVLAVQTAAAQLWAKAVTNEMNMKVQAELQAAVAAEQNALQNDIAGPPPAPEAPPAQ